MKVLLKSAALSVRASIYRIRLSGKICLGLLLVTSILLTQCLRATGTKPAKSGGNSEVDSVADLTPDEYAVYNAVIEAKHRRYARAGKDLVVISNRTFVYKLSPKTLDETLKWASDHTPGGIAPELVESLERQNAQSHEISDLFSLNVKHVLVTEDEINNLMKGGEWELFYDKYPKSQGIISLSRVGFDASKTQALVYFGNPTSATSGGGAYILLEKKGGTWIVKREIPMWVI
jgi:hypothetical protein